MAMPDRPTGTVTFLFTDIEGSTRLWAEHGDAMGAAVTRHDDLIREAIEGNAGYVFATGGDSFAAAFPTALNAVTAAVEAQLALAGGEWGETPIRVRIGVHTGEAEERDGDYFGPVVNETARLMAPAHGGQIVASVDTARISGGALPDGVGFTDLGELRLRDVAEPIRVMQVTHTDLRDTFPPLRGLVETPNNLPREMTSFVGRDRELDEVTDLVRDSRLVTLTGAGGSGKTRLALRFAHGVLGEYPDGVWFVDLAVLDNPGRVAATVARTVGMAEVAADEMVDRLIERLEDRTMLLILDNCEHVIEVAASLASEVFGRTEAVRIVATSRQPLGVAGEQPYRVPTLDTPADPVDDPEAMCGFAAVRLFCERAQTARRGFEVTADNAEAVGRVCRRLDGLPLALELAAVRLNILDPEGLLRRLDDRFALLTGGVGDQVDRHRTLTATLEWSYDLLTAEEQTLLNRLSVFVGGFTLDAAEDVCAGGAIVPDRVLDLVSSLVDQSLIVPYQGAVGRRFRFLETVREYATGRLADSGEAELVAEHHGTYFHRLVVDSFDLFWGPDDIMWLDRLDEEWPNISRALAWYVDERRSQDGLFMAGSLYRLAFRRHYETVTIAWLDRLLASDATPSAARARALLGRASLELDGRHSMSLFQEAVGLCREFGSVLDLGAVLHNAVSSSMETGEWETARELVTELVSLEIVDPDSRSLDVTQQATMALQADANPVLALSLVEEGLDLARQSDSPERVADVLRLTAMICRYTGDLDRADDALREAAQLEAAIDHKQANVGATELFFAEVALDRSEPERAIEYLMEHARLVQPLADEDDASDSLIAQGLDVWGRAAIARERYVVAVTLLAAHAAYMQHWSLTNYPTFQAEINKALETARDRLDADSYQQAWERGSAMTIHDALAYAVEHLAPASAD